MNRGHKFKFGFSKGSALILTVVLSSILAIVAVLFLLASRVETLSTSSLIDERDLNLAVDTVISKLSDELVLDTPGVAGQEYYDYPGEEDKWLASIEPYKDGTVYKWGQISDLTGYIRRNFGTNQVVKDVNVAPKNLSTTTRVREYSEIVLDKDGNLEETSADADGDGIADSKWFELEDDMGSRGKKVYAAVRVIDNAGMLNVNTAYQFDANSSEILRIDGSHLHQINLDALGRSPDDADAIFSVRSNIGAASPSINELNDYERYGAWKLADPCDNYTPFDISDELELRYRFLVSSPAITRIENTWEDTISEKWKYVADRPYDTRTNPPTGPDWGLEDWERRVTEPNNIGFDRRHLLTSYSYDRIIAADGKKMANVNRINEPNYLDSLYTALRNATDSNSIAAQTAVNLKDYVDADSDITPFVASDGVRYYGFERPCIYISELAHCFVRDPCDPNIVYRSYAIELYKPYPEDLYPEPNQWRLSIPGYSGSPIPITWSGSKHFHVIRWQDPCAPLSVSLAHDSNFPAIAQEPPYSRFAIVFDANNVISLQRRVDVNKPDPYVVVDSVVMPNADIATGWLIADENPHSIQRDITLHKCIRRLWGDVRAPTLGGTNVYPPGDSLYIQAHPANEGPLTFTNVGQVGMIFRKAAYYPVDGNNADVIGYSINNKIERNVRLNLADPNFQGVMNYLTVFDPTIDGIDNDGDGITDESSSPPVAGDELQVPGRINVNTAPWFVIAQLPWMTPDIARDVVARRDAASVQGFRSTADLIDVNEMRRYASDGNDLAAFPDLSPGDDAIDDFEERDVIFARISNLATVRSDVFTAYILIRLGRDGPQKRVVALLDRSDVYKSGDKVKVLAVHDVSYPR